MEKSGALVKKELKVSGNVRWSTHTFFFNNFGKLKMALNWFLYLIFALIKLAGDFWLGFWSKDEFKQSDFAYMLIYLALWLGLLITLILRIIYFSKSSAKNSFNLNSRLVASLMRRP